MFIFRFLLHHAMVLSLFGKTCGSEKRSRFGAVLTAVNYKLLGHQIQILKGGYQTLLSCAQLCLADKRCESTNFGVTGDNDVLCELNVHSIPFLSEGLTYAEGFTFSLYSKVNFDLNHGDSIKDNCENITCLNQGQCSFSQKKQNVHCKCHLPWVGDNCETKIDVLFNFTSLGADGRMGPTNNKKYHGTSLEGVLVKKGLQTWLVPVTGKYIFELCGASGGDHPHYNTEGGRGARIRGSIHLLQGTQLTVLVGQSKVNNGGGGGTFVVYAADNSPLAIAGGGGSADIVNGDPGQRGNLGSINSGDVGDGGNVCASVSRVNSVRGTGGGGGFTTSGRCFEKGLCNKPCPSKDGGKAFTAGGQGGYNNKFQCEGGFGGGGNCGGGGGYTGGGVQVSGSVRDLHVHSGGGGSYVPSDNWTVVSGDCSVGNGFVTVELLAIAN
ncbi:ALK tyrosine kinase receptor-like [Montipora foliosa]|uniref:ALK tyrosine kinase receptor-like n=1 Tax=Montipora foliosa TaxID=591990 RepID=UPI0035F0FAB8